MHLHSTVQGDSWHILDRHWGRAFASASKGVHVLFFLCSLFAFPAAVAVGGSVSVGMAVSVCLSAAVVVNIIGGEGDIWFAVVCVVVIQPLLRESVRPVIGPVLAPVLPIVLLAIVPTTVHFTGATVRRGDVDAEIRRDDAIRVVCMYFCSSSV